ncbi:hypothetical protein [Glutamicibacter sp. NPDC087344]|uniref:hypothetical protein n=1 Tax=Glutamicibacter sp. NPDC087344 TaxID=3363994 RepID=UPI00380FFAC9
MKWIILALIILAVVILVLRVAQARAERNLHNSPNARPGTIHDIDQLVANGQKIEAIKKLRATDPTLSLREAKNRIDYWTPENKPYAESAAARSAQAGTPLPAHVIVEIDQLVAADNPIRAIKVLREHTGLGLKEAKNRIDRWVPGRN